MKLSTKGTYGLRALIDLAIHSNGIQQSLASIANRQNISEIYLEQVFSTLRKAGIVKSVKGAQGGYLLAKEPQHINAGAVLRILEGDLSVIDEGVSSSFETNSISNCVKVNVWDKIDAKVDALLNAVTLENLIEEHNNIHGIKVEMFYI